MNSVRQRRNNIAILLINKIKIKPRVKNKIIFFMLQRIRWTMLKIFFVLFSILRGICKRIFAGPEKSKNMELYLNHLAL